MEDKKIYVPIILGTARKERESEKVARFVMEEAKEFGFDAELIDVRDYRWGETIPTWAEDTTATKRWRDIAERADGFIIVVPEYNHGYPGELKILLDGAYKEYAKKPVGLCGVSSGLVGGARVVDHLKQVLVELSMVPLRNALYFPSVGDIFDDGVLKDEAYKERTKPMFEELAWYGKVLKNAKQADAKS
ncbi:MAG: NAD(P)H-dependent oxidoreductase [Patescibacteria group bacterium]|nr:MAG: NAD(P)H-dependent oxidoreductase [Patescibacteria group bacterium]